MLRVKASVRIQQSIEEVFRFVAKDFKGDGRSETSFFQVTRDDPYHTFSWKALQSDEANRASSWQSYVQVYYTFDPLPEGTQVSCECQVILGRGFKRKLAEWYLIGPLRTEVQQWIANLKELLETPASAAPQPARDGLEELVPVVQPEEGQEVQLQQGGQAPFTQAFSKGTSYSRDLRSRWSALLPGYFPLLRSVPKLCPGGMRYHFCKRYPQRQSSLVSPLL